MIVLFSLIQARLPSVFEKVQFSHLPDPSFIVDFAKAGVVLVAIMLTIVGSMAVDGRVKLRRSKFGISFWYIMVA
jgi:hypothetical protein